MTSTKKLSPKGLKACKDSLRGLIEMSSELTEGFDIFEAAIEQFDLPISTQSIAECREMVTAMNRLMFQELSEVSHQQSMASAHKKARAFLDSHNTQLGLTIN